MTTKRLARKHNKPEQSIKKEEKTITEVQEQQNECIYHT